MNQDKTIDNAAPVATKAEASAPPSTEQHTAESIVGWVVAALEDLKAIDIRVLDVRGHCNFTDFMVFSSGTSDRHLKSQANNVIVQVKNHGIRPMGVEGDDVPNTEWVLVDLVDVIVHIMLPETRDYYQLEKLWSVPGGQQSTTERPSLGSSASAATVASLAGGQSAYAMALEKLCQGADLETAIGDWDDDEEPQDDDLDDWDDERPSDETPPAHRT
jgi:ribosome-associated protein